MARSQLALLLGAAFLAVANAATSYINPTMEYDPSPTGRTSYSFTAWYTGTTVYYRLDSGSWVTAATGNVAGTNASTPITLSKGTTGDIKTDGGHCIETKDDTETNAFDTTMYCWTIETFGTQADNHGGCTFGYSLNSAPTTMDTSDSTGRTLKFSNFVEGTNSFDVMAYDTYGHTSDTNTFTWTTDTTCPSTEFTSAGKTMAGAKSAVTDTSRYFAYSSTDTSARIKFSIDDGPWQIDSGDSMGSGSFTATFPVTSCKATEHSFAVMAVDAVGNGCDAVKYSFTVEPVDTAVTLSNAVTGTALSGSTGNFVFSASSGAGVSQSVKRYEYSLNGGSWTSSDATLTLTELPEGAHTLLVRAVSTTITDIGTCTDPTPAKLEFSVDYSAPVTTIGAQYLPTSPTSEHDFTMYGTVSDLNVKSDGTMYKLGDVEWYAPVPCAGCPDNTFAITLTGLVDGDYNLQVKSTDALGNAEAWTTVATWTVDSGAASMDTLIVSGAPSPMLAGGAALFVFGTTTNTPAVFYYALSDSEGMGAWNFADGSSVTFEDLQPGMYTLYVYAQDAVGNKDETPSTYTWTVYPEDMYNSYLSVAGWSSVESTPLTFTPEDMDFVHLEPMDAM